MANRMMIADTTHEHMMTSIATLRHIVHSLGHFVINSTRPATKKINKM